MYTHIYQCVPAHEELAGKRRFGCRRLGRFHNVAVLARCVLNVTQLPHTHPHTACNVRILVYIYI